MYILVGAAVVVCFMTNQWRVISMGVYRYVEWVSTHFVTPGESEEGNILVDTSPLNAAKTIPLSRPILAEQMTPFRQMVLLGSHHNCTLL